MAAVTGSQPYFMLTLDKNPLTEFVKFPEEAIESGLWFDNVICGVLCVALKMVHCGAKLYTYSCHDDASHRFKYGLKLTSSLMF